MIITFMSLYATEELCLSYTQAGIIMGAFGLGSILGSFIGGKLTDKINYYDIQWSSLTISGLIAFSMYFVRDFYPILFLVFAFSLTADTFRPANAIAVSTYAKKENITRSFSLMRLAINLGFTIGPAVGGVVAQHYGFKWIFVLEGATCLLAALALVSFLPKKHALKSHEESRSTDKGNKVIHDLVFIKFLIFTFLFAFCFFQLFTSVPLYMHDLWGYSTETIGYILSLNGLLIVMVEMPLITKVDGKRSNFRFIQLGCILLALSYLILIAPLNAIVIVLLFISIITFAEIFAMPFMMNFVITRPAKRRQGEYIALYSIAYGLSHITAPSVGLYIAENYNFIVLYSFIALLAFATAWGFYILSKSQIENA